MSKGIRCVCLQVESSAERVQKKIRNSELQKIPLTAVVGPAEAVSLARALSSLFSRPLSFSPTLSRAQSFLLSLLSLPSLSL